jgi:2,5-diketo-D-gluconate reductase A
VTSKPSVRSVQLNDGAELPQLGFGTFLAAPDEVTDAVRTAIHSGYRLIDTASIYANEEAVGRALSSSDVPSDELLVTTKVWNDDHGYDATMRAFDESLKKLGLDRIALYLIHWPRPKLDRYRDTWRALERLQSDGRTRSIGVSNFGEQELTRLMDESSVVPSLNQIELHPGMTQQSLRSFHAEHSIVTQAWSPIGRNQGVLEHPDVLAIAAAHSRTPAQVVLRWHVQLDVVAIPKSVRASRIEGNIAVFDFELSDSEMDRLTGIDADTKVRPDPSLFYDLS